MTRSPLDALRPESVPVVFRRLFFVWHRTVTHFAELRGNLPALPELDDELYDLGAGRPALRLPTDVYRLPVAEPASCVAPPHRLISPSPCSWPILQDCS